MASHSGIDELYQEGEITPLALIIETKLQLLRNPSLQDRRPRVVSKTILRPMWLCPGVTRKPDREYIDP